MTRHPSNHAAWPLLTDDQRSAVNEVWDEMVIPALEQVDAMRAERDAALLEAQDARSEARNVKST